MKDEPDGLNEMDWWSRARLHDPHDLTMCRCVALVPWTRKLWWSTDADSWKQSEYQTFWDPTDWPRSFFAARLWLGPWAVVLGIIPLKPDCLIFCLIILLSPNRFPMQDSQQISSWHQPFELKSAAQWLAVQLTGSKEFLCFADVAEKMMPKTAQRPKSVPFLDLNETAQSSKTKTWWV